MDYTNKSLGLRVQTQIPLDVKKYIESEEALKDLGIANNLAFTYIKGLIIYCILEGTRYQWKEYEDGDETLLDNNFIYPDNIICFGIDYSNKEYNFAKYEISTPIEPQGFQDVLNIDSELPFGNFINVQQDFILKSGGFNPYNGLEIRHPDLATSSVPIVKMGNGMGNINTELNINFFPTRATFRDGLNSRGIEYHGDYESNFLPRTLVTRQYVDTQINNIPQPDGSETKISNGITTEKTGNGTIATPYIIEVKNNQKVLTYPGDFTGINYTLTNSDFDTLIFINNGATNVTITVPTGLVDKFYSVFIRQGSGEVSIVASGTTINTPIGLRITLQNDHICLDKVGSTEIFHLTGNNKV